MPLRVQVTDAAFLGLPKPLAWRMLGLQPLNEELAAALSPAEMALHAAAAGGADVSTAQVLAALSPLAMEFGMAELGAPPAAVHLELSNSGGHLPVSWAISLQDAPDVEVRLSHPALDMYIFRELYDEHLGPFI